MLFKHFFTFALTFALAATATAADWELTKTEDEPAIEVYTRAVEGSPLKEFKGVTQLKSTLHGAVALVRDTENMPSWMFNMLSIRVLKEVNEREAYTYSVTKTGPFMDDRDSIVYSAVSQDPATKVVTMTLEGKPEYIPATDDAVRVTSVNGMWKFTPKDNGMIEVVYQLHADPSGSLPQSLINSFIVKSPIESLSGLHEQIANYQDKKLTYITE